MAPRHCSVTVGVVQHSPTRRTLPSRCTGSNGLPWRQPSTVQEGRKEGRKVSPRTPDAAAVVTSAQKHSEGSPSHWLTKKMSNPGQCYSGHERHIVLARQSTWSVTLNDLINMMKCHGCSKDHGLVGSRMRPLRYSRRKSRILQWMQWPIRS